MPQRHNNATQLAEVETLAPLLQNEDPYYKNINRAPKNAYTYADNINNMLSYGGTVSRLLPAGSQTFNLYDIVAILDGETITQAIQTSGTAPTRFGIVVTLLDDEGKYTVCTFCPNFVYPTGISADITGWAGVSLPGTTLYLDVTGSTPASNYWLTTSSGETNAIYTTSVGLAKITGATSMFFCGTVRLFS